MSTHSDSRRDFLRASAATVAAWSITSNSGARAAQEPVGVRAHAAQEAASASPPRLERRKFGRSGIEVTLLGFGGAEIGYGKTDAATVEKLLNGALDSGLNVVDTAECYLESEVQIAAAIGHRRKDYHLFTKCGHAKDDAGADLGWSKEGVQRSVERSLKRLKTDHVDLVLLHSCSLEELQKGDCIEGLEQAKKAGKTRLIGYSGDSRAARYAVESGRFDALQTSVNLCDQESIELLLPLALEKQMGVIAKRPIANAVWRYDEEPKNGYHVGYWKRLQALDYPFAKGALRDAQTPDGAAGVALRFTAMQPGVDVLIVGTTKPERWNQNAELLAAGPLPKELEASIRAKWKKTAEADWTGQT